MAADITPGVASDNAHGHVTTITLMAIQRARSGAIESQTNPVTAATTKIKLKNRLACLSASNTIGGFSVAAASIMPIKADKCVSIPTFSALTTSVPLPFVAPAITWSPACFGTATDSPVMSDSSHSLLPSTTTPSAGMCSPGATNTTSSTHKAIASNDSTSRLIG